MSILGVDDELRLRPVAGGTAESPESGSAPIESYVVEHRTGADWAAIGEVTLDPRSLMLHLEAAHRRQGLGRRIVFRLVDRARVLGWAELRVAGLDTADPADDVAVAFVGSLGFLARTEGDPPQVVHVLRLAPFGGRPRA